MSVEIDKQKTYIKGVLTLANSRVWCKFPPELQPDMGIIAPRITIGTLREDELVIHPGIPEPFRSEIVRSKMDADATASPSRIAMHDPITRTITVKPEAFKLEEPRLKRIIYHETGEDLFSQQQIIPFDKLSEADRKKVVEYVKYIFGESKDPRTTHICKFGFRKVLMEGKYAITDIYPEAAELNEIFPTAFEMLTEQLFFRNGDIRLLEKRIGEGKIKAPPYEDHPVFFSVFFHLLRKINWKQFLMAFKPGEMEELMSTFSAILGNESSIELLRLVEDMESDERNIREFNGMLTNRIF